MPFSRSGFRQEEAVDKGRENQIATERAPWRPLGFYPGTAREASRPSSRWGSWQQDLGPASRPEFWTQCSYSYLRWLWQRHHGSTGYLGWEKAQYSKLHPCALGLAWGRSHGVYPYTLIGMRSVLHKEKRTQSTETAWSGLGLRRQDAPRWARCSSCCRCCRMEARAVDPMGDDIQQRPEATRRLPEDLPCTQTTSCAWWQANSWERRKFNTQFGLFNNWVWTLKWLFALKCLYSRPQWLKYPELDNFSYSWCFTEPLQNKLILHGTLSAFRKHLPWKHSYLVSHYN